MTIAEQFWSQPIFEFLSPFQVTQSAYKLVVYTVWIGRTTRYMIVYNLRTQNFSFVAPIPEQIGTTTMHFPDQCVRRYILKVARIKVG